jgi:DNA-binding HxlR family transcriptional regulator
MPPKKAHVLVSKLHQETPHKCGTIRDILSRLGDKWSIVAIVLLGQGPLRFGELLRLGHGVSQRMLTHTLRQLERDGLVWRKVTPTVPLTVEYGLTALGCDLFKVLQPFFEWADHHAADIAAAQHTYDQRQAGEAGA